MIKNWPLQIVSKYDVLSLHPLSEKKCKKKKFLHWIDWEIGTTFHEQLQCKLKQKQKKNVRLHLTPNWKGLLRHTCLYCWRNSALGSLMFGSSQKVMQKLYEDNKNKESVVPLCPWIITLPWNSSSKDHVKNITKAENIFFPLPEVRTSGRILHENRRMEITAKNMRLLSTNSWVWIFVFKMNFEQELENCEKCPYK